VRIVENGNKNGGEVWLVVGAGWANSGGTVEENPGDKEWAENDMEQLC